MTTQSRSDASDRFEETAWSMVLAAGGEPNSHAREALAELCRIYWPPIYGYIRRRGHSAEDAQDLTQSFFQHILEHETIRRATRARGRFRNFLIGAVKNCLADEHARASALKRGGAFQFVSLQELAAEEEHQLRLSSELSPAELLEVRWAGVLLERALAKTRTDFAAEGRAEAFDLLSTFLGGEKAELSYETAADRLGVSLGAVKTLIHRLRRKFAETVRREIVQTVSAPHEVDDELRRLRAAFARAAERRAA